MVVVDSVKAKRSEDRNGLLYSTKLSGPIHISGNGLNLSEECGKFSVFYVGVQASALTYISILINDF